MRDWEAPTETVPQSTPVENEQPVGEPVGITEDRVLFSVAVTKDSRTLQTGSPDERPESRIVAVQVNPDRPARIRELLDGVRNIPEELDVEGRIEGPVPFVHAHLDPVDVMGVSKREPVVLGGGALQPEGGTEPGSVPRPEMI